MNIVKPTRANGSQNVEHMIIDPFPASLDSLLPSAMGAPTAERDAYQYLCKLAVLLGRILSFTRTSPRSIHSQADHEQLMGALSRFLLGIPKNYRAAIGASAAELPTVLLLGCTLNACSIFLHSTSSDDGRSEGCFKAVENILALVRNISSTMDLTDDRVYGNPLLAPILLLGARILAGKYLSSGSATEETVRNNLELLLGTLGRMEEGWPRLAGLVKGIVREDLKREPGA